MGLPNVRFLPYQPKAHLAESLQRGGRPPCAARSAGGILPDAQQTLRGAGLRHAVSGRGRGRVRIGRVDPPIRRRPGRPPGEPEALADLLVRLADQTWDLPEMGARARRLAEAEYDRRGVTSRFRTLLKGVLGA